MAEGTTVGGGGEGHEREPAQQEGGGAPHEVGVAVVDPTVGDNGEEGDQENGGEAEEAEEVLAGIGSPSAEPVLDGDWRGGIDGGIHGGVGEEGDGCAGTPDHKNKAQDLM